MNKKKNIYAFILLIVGGILSLTFSYFSDTFIKENKFKALKYGSIAEEKFKAPNNWVPGDKVAKSLTIKNLGDVDEAVRVTYEEQWISKNGKKLPLKQGNNDVVDIHWINSDDWTREENTFYYNYKLTSHETTSELLDYVIFNPEVTLENNCITTKDGDYTIRTCNSNGNGYDGATYTLKFIIETVQYDKYQDIWDTNVVIE